VSPTALGIALQGLLLGPLPIALQGLAGVAAPADDAPRSGGGRTRRPRPMWPSPAAQADAQDLEALLLTEAL
jgi:hypothetical protein